MTNVFDHLTDRVIAFSPCFAKITGSLASGVLLAQLLYWHKAMDGKEFYKTDAELIEETGLSRHEFRSAKGKLKDKGFVTTKLKKSPAKTHFKVDKDSIIKAISRLPKSGKLDYRKPANKFTEIRQTGLPKSDQLIHTEITSKITSENNNNKTPEKSENSKPKKPVLNAQARFKSPEEMAIEARKADQKADCQRFLEYAVKKHELQRGIPLIINPERDPEHVYRLVVIKGLSAQVLIRCWDEFVKTERGWFAGKTRTIPLFAKEDVLQTLLERTRALELEEAGKAEAKKTPPKVCLDPDYEALWKKCLEAMRPDILEDNFDAYLAPSIGLVITRDRVVIGVPTSFHVGCLRENYQSHIKTGLAAVGITPAPILEFIHEFEVVDV